MKRLWISLIILAVTGSAGAAGFVVWRNHVITRQIALRETALSKALAEHRSRQALVLVDDLRRAAAGRATPAQQEQWRGWELQACVEARDIRRLLALHERSPRQVQANEDAALLVARALTAAGRDEAAASLRGAWRGQEKQPASWQAYDADLFIRAGQPEEAKSVLRAASFTGTAESNRLLRLAMISTGQPEEAIRYLDGAYAADARNPDLRTFRAQLLERKGQTARARVEYTAALLAAPENPLLRDQLGEFYLRQQEYPMAVQTFSEGSDLEAGDFLHWKGLFWSVLTSGPTPAQTAKPGSLGVLQPLSQMLAAVPSTRFWDEGAFAKLRAARNYEATRQEIYWLRLLQDLQDGQETKAAESIAGNRFRAGSFEPELERALAAVLRYRLTGAAPGLDALGPTTGQRHSLLQQLADWGRGTPAPGLEEFVAGPHAIAGVLLAFGWTEAALRMAPMAKGVEAAPEWYRFALVQALRLNRGAEAALALAKTQPRTPLLQMLTGEILLSLKQEAAAREALEPVAADYSEAGYRAAWLLATQAAEKQEYARVRSYVQGQPRLANDTLGLELLARITAAEGRAEEAAAQYTALADRSAEAKTFLVRRAIAAKQWAEARKLTEQLIDQYPDEMTLRQNLAYIDGAAK